MDAIKVHGLDSITILDHYRMGRLSNILDGIKNKLNKKKKIFPTSQAHSIFWSKAAESSGGEEGRGDVEREIAMCSFPLPNLLVFYAWQQFYNYVAKRYVVHVVP